LHEAPSETVNVVVRGQSLLSKFIPSSSVDIYSEGVIKFPFVGDLSIPTGVGRTVGGVASINTVSSSSLLNGDTIIVLSSAIPALTPLANGITNIRLRSDVDMCIGATTVGAGKDGGITIPGNQVTIFGMDKTSVFTNGVFVNIGTGINIENHMVTSSSLSGDNTIITLKLPLILNHASGTPITLDVSGGYLINAVSVGAGSIVSTGIDLTKIFYIGSSVVIGIGDKREIITVSSAIYSNGNTTIGLFFNTEISHDSETRIWIDVDGRIAIKATPIGKTYITIEGRDITGLFNQGKNIHLLGGPFLNSTDFHEHCVVSSSIFTGGNTVVNLVSALTKNHIKGTEVKL
jgi:hypothetical protein